jgi:DNA-binding MarR family transcriptional regulator
MEDRGQGMTDPLDEELAARQAKTVATKRKSSGDRWARLNQFVDSLMKDMTHAQRGTFVYMFRHERNGTVATSVRQIANGTGMDKSSVQRALTQLTQRGIVEVVKKSKSHGSPSIFRLNTDP